MRLSWLPRLIERYSSSGHVPSNLESIACDLGVGKNMAKSMRAWGRAAGLIQDDGEISRLGNQMFQTYDKYLERGESVALLHWLIASNTTCFTSVAWVFNFVRTDTFTLEDSVTGFRNHLAMNGAQYADATLRGDIEAGVRMHALGTGATPYDDEARFFSRLRFLSVKRVGTRSEYSRTWEDSRNQVSDRLLLYSVLQSLARRKTATSALSELYAASEGRSSPGIVFGLSRNGFFELVESLSQNSKGDLKLSTMPGEDALLSAHGNTGKICSTRDLNSIDAWFFEGRNL